VQKTFVHLAGDSRIVDHHVESAEMIHCSLYDGADVLGNRDINMLEPCTGSALVGQLLTVVVVDIGDDHGRAGIHEPSYNSTA